MIRYSTIINHVLITENLEREKVCSESRKQELCEARYIIWTLARKFTDISLSKIGIPFGRCHSDVLTGIRRFDNLMFTEIAKEKKYKKYVNYFNDVLQAESNKHIIRPYTPGRIAWKRNRPMTRNLELFLHN